jgi:hypothetical protein
MENEVSIFTSLLESLDELSASWDPSALSKEDAKDHPVRCLKKVLDQNEELQRFLDKRMSSGLECLLTNLN